MATVRDLGRDVDAFGQEGSDQAAYDEHFLSEDGTSGTVRPRRLTMPRIDDNLPV